jgi:hypothetical protein
MEWITAIEPHFSYAKTRGFIMAIQKLYYLGSFDIERLLHKFQMGIKPERKPSAKLYLTELQTIYNFAERSRNRMHFVKA